MKAIMKTTMKILVPEHLLEELRGPAQEAAPEVELLPYGETETTVIGQEDGVALLRWVWGKQYARIVHQMPNIRWLHTASAGVDHVLTPEIKANTELTVTDSGPAFEIAISEFVLAWMLLVARGLPTLMAHQQEHLWKPVPQIELHGKTVGIIGLGPIGRGTAIRAKAFGMHTLGMRRRAAPVESVEEIVTGPEGLDRLLTASDFVVIAAALTRETQALIGPEQLARMKPTAWLINIARGGLIDEPALIAALQTGEIGGACLDVFAQEPLPPDNPLWEMPNVYLAPHNSPGGDPNLHTRQKAIFLENLHRFVRGAPLENVVDKTRGY